jgi:iron(III) transport system ATP-binding protein
MKSHAFSILLYEEIIMIEVKDLEIKYGDFVAVQNIDFHVEEGEFFTLLGPSGCGKTTTLQAIAGFLDPSEGKIFVGQENMTHVPVEKREIGMVFQSYALFPTMTVYDNIAYGLKVDRMDKEKISERVYELAKLVDLEEEQLEKNVSELSGGQQQRVAIARSLAKKPSVVLFDEPLSNLDAKLRKQLRQELKNIQRNTGMTAIYVTHDQQEALEMSNKIAVFNKGNIEQIGTPEEIYDNSATEFVCTFIGDANKLGADFIEYINKHSAVNLDKKKVHYLREEKISMYSNRQNHSIEIDAEIEHITFQGKAITYECKALDSNLKFVAHNRRGSNLTIGDKIKIYLDPTDILEYEVS